MNNKTIGVLMLVISALGCIGTAWLSAFIPEKYWFACAVQGAILFVIGLAGSIVLSEANP